MRGFTLAAALTLGLLGVYGTATASYIADKAPAELMGTSLSDLRDKRLGLSIGPSDPASELDWAKAWTVFRLATEKYQGTVRQNIDEMLAPDAQRYDIGGAVLDFSAKLLGLGGADQRPQSWFRRAAEADQPEAQACLGALYFLLGDSRVPDYVVTAQMWLGVAAARLPNGQLLDAVDQLRDALADRLSPAQLAEAERLARDWKPADK